MISENKNTGDWPFLAAAMVLSLLAIGVFWHFVIQNFIPASYRIDMLDLFFEHFKQIEYFEVYTTRVWSILIKINYPYYFTVAAFVGVLTQGFAFSYEARNSTCLSYAVGGWLLGAGFGWLMYLSFPFSHPMFKALSMPLIAFFAGLLAPLLVSPLSTRLIRGTSISTHYGKSQKVIAKAIKRGRTCIAGVILDQEAETRHFAVIGNTGSGKSTALRELMYTTMCRRDQHIVSDADGGAMSVFYRQGDVILNPFDRRSAKWDILAEIQEESDYRFLAESVLPYTGGRDSDQWLTYAQQIFAACLRTWHKNDLGSSDAFFTALAIESTDKIAKLCEGSAAHRYFESGNERMLASIMGTLAPALENMQPITQIEGEGFSVRQWLRAGKGTLWMPYKASQIASLRGLISCWMRLAIFELLSLAPSQVRRVWPHIDELDAIGRIEGLKDAQARTRKAGGCIALGFQSIAQVRAVYGDADAKTIIENCGNKLVLHCEASEGGGTAHFASDIIGEREIARDEMTRSRTSGKHGSSTQTTHTRWHTEKAVLSSEIMQLPDRTGYLKVATRSDWMKVSFDYIPFEPRIDAYIPR